MSETTEPRCSTRVIAYTGETVGAHFADDHGEMYDTPQLVVQLDADISVAHKQVLIVELPPDRDTRLNLIAEIGKTLTRLQEETE